MKAIKGFFSRIWIFLLYLIGVGIQLLLDFSQAGQNRDLAGLIITAGFFAVILILFLIAFANLCKARAFGNDLDRASAILRKNRMQGKEDLLPALWEEGVFTQKSLCDAVSSYKNDVEKLKAVSPKRKLDIENYINLDLMEENMSMHFMNQIAGAMTGLGILGTFLGLSIGLSRFNFSGGDISQEISPLMDGIKIAFHTSIIGLVYSLGFNFFFRSFVSAETSRLDHFLEIFRRYVFTIAEDETADNYRYQEKITALLQEQLNRQYDQRDFVYDVTKQVVEHTAKLLYEMIVPEINKVADSVDRFAAETQKDQQEGLERIVDSFIAKMNASLGSSFRSLQDIINKTSSWQSQALIEQQYTLDQISRMAVDLEQISKDLEEAIGQTSSYTGQIQDYQQRMHENALSMNELVTHQTELCNSMSENEAAVLRCMTAFLDQASQQSQALNAMSNEIAERSGKQLIDLEESAESYINEMARAAAAERRELMDTYRKQGSSAAGKGRNNSGIFGRKSQ